MEKAVKRMLSAALAALLCLPVAARGAGSWRTLAEGADTDSYFLISEYTGEVRITFLGDCTLGGPENRKNSALGFARRVAENGPDFPFRELRRLTGEDDLTVANLEGVLSDRALEKVPKEYNFIGPSAYTEILASGGIDCVTLANNHSHDYGPAGYADTKAALEGAGIAWFGTDAPAVWQNEEGLKIGFLGVSWSLTGNRYRQYAAQARMLRDIGCAAVITVMHAGTEYEYAAPDSYQRQIVRRAAACGSCLIIGHHPHVVQGVETVDGVPAVYSLGNCVFGGTTRAKDSDALLAQAVLTFREGELTDLALHFHPISITGDSRYNNYSPRFLTGDGAERVLEKMRKSTGTDPGAWDEREGAVWTGFTLPAAP